MAYIKPYGLVFTGECCFSLNRRQWIFEDSLQKFEGSFNPVSIPKRRFKITMEPIIKLFAYVKHKFEI